MGELDCSTSRKWGHVSRQPYGLSWVMSRREMRWMGPHLRRHRQIYNFLQLWLEPDHGKKLSKWKMINPDVKQNCRPQVIWNQVTGKTDQVTPQKNGLNVKGGQNLGCSNTRSLPSGHTDSFRAFCLLRKMWMTSLRNCSREGGVVKGIWRWEEKMWMGLLVNSLPALSLGASFLTSVHLSILICKTKVRVPFRPTS